MVFIDESGLSQKPHRCRSWAPRGETPVLQFNFNWQKLSVAAGLTLRNSYFRLYPGAIGQVEVIDFLKALVRHIDQPLLIVWDRLPAHRSRLVREFIELSEGHIVTEYLPPLCAGTQTRWSTSGRIGSSMSCRMFVPKTTGS